VPANVSRWIFVVVAVVGAGGLLAAKVYERARPGVPSWLAGDEARKMDVLAVSGRAPAVEAVDEKGAVKTLESLRGRVVLLNFWFSDCAPCREEMASLDALAKGMGKGGNGVNGLKVVALSVDPSWEKVRGFHEAEPALRGRKPGVGYEVWLDAKKQTPPRYGSFKFPETFLIGRDGELLGRFVGPRDWSTPASVGLMRRVLAGE